MKLVYMIQSTFNSGGTERVLVNKVNYLADKLKHDITIITTDQQNRKPFFEFSKKIKHIDLSINYLELKQWGPIPRLYHFILKQKRHKKELSKLLTLIRADIVISMYGSEMRIVPFIQDNSKKILELHFSKDFRLLYEKSLNRGCVMQIMSIIRDYWEKRAINKYDKFIVLTKEDKEAWGNKKNIEVIYNACSFKPSRKSKLEANSAIAVGRLSAQKGFDMLISVWYKVIEKHPNWKLNIFGSGEDKKKLIQQIESLNLNNNIQILSPTPNIQEEYLNSSIFLFSSRYEGFGLVLVEAMSCGLPVVAFSCPCGPKDIITDNINGYLVPNGNINEMADKICKLIENKELRNDMGIKAIENSYRFSQEVIMEQWNTLFDSLIK